MPWHISSEGDKYCVIADDDGKNMGCHETREQAEEHMRALYANMDEMDKSASFPELKSFAIGPEDAEMTGNQFRGVPSVMGNVDDGGDVIFPGAFDEKVLNDFLFEGFIPFGHNWDDPPIATPTLIKAQGNKLIAAAEFHNTERAQEIRTVMKERLERGKSVGLSIGFQTGETKMFENGEKLLSHAAELKSDMGVFDVDGIKAHTRPLRGILKIARLFEFSPVTVPMNRLALATGAKSTFVLTPEDFNELTDEQSIERFLRDAGFSRKAAVKFISHFKGIYLPRDAGGDAPDPDGGPVPPAETAGQEPPAEPVVALPAKPPAEPFFFTADGKDYSRWIMLNS